MLKLKIKYDHITNKPAYFSKILVITCENRKNTIVQLLEGIWAMLPLLLFSANRKIYFVVFVSSS